MVSYVVVVVYLLLLLFTVAEMEKMIKKLGAADASRIRSEL